MRRREVRRAVLLGAAVLVLACAGCRGQASAPDPAPASSSVRDIDDIETSLDNIESQLNEP